MASWNMKPFRAAMTLPRNVYNPNAGQANIIPPTSSIWTQPQRSRFNPANLAPHWNTPYLQGLLRQRFTGTF